MDVTMGQCLPLQIGDTRLVRCAAAPNEQLEQPEQGPEKRCLRCGDRRTLFYFPLRKSQPDGHWVHCYACQHALRLEAKPPRRCA